MDQLAQTLLHLGLAATAGALIWRCTPWGTTPRARQRLTQLARGWAVLWILACPVVAFFAAAEVQQELISNPGWDELAAMWSLPTTRGLCFAAFIGLVVILLADASPQASPHESLLIAALPFLAAAPLVSQGHQIATENHLLANVAVVGHSFAAMIWCGGLAIFAAFVNSVPVQLRGAAMAWWSRVAWLAFAVLVIAGLTTAWARGVLHGEIWGSSYGNLLAAKVGLLALLGAAGWWHRIQLHRQPQREASASSNRLVLGGQLLLMLTAIGLASSLSTTAPPTATLTSAVPPHPQTFAVVDPDLAPLTWLRLLLGVADHELVVAYTVLGLALLLLGFTATSQGRLGFDWRGFGLRGWLGLVLAWSALAGGLAAYAGTVAWVFALQLVVVGLIVPWLWRPIVNRLLIGVQPGWWSGPTWLVGLAIGWWTLMASGLGSGLLMHSSAVLSWCGLLVGLIGGCLLLRQPPPLVGFFALATAVWWTLAWPVLGGWFELTSRWWTNPATDQQLGVVVFVVAGLAALDMPRPRLASQTASRTANQTARQTANHTGVI